MARVVGDIAVEVSADITGLQRGLARGGQSVSDFGSKAQQMAATMASVTKGIAAVGAVAVTATATLAKVARGIAETGDAAKRAGVNFEDFQRLGFVAQQNRIDIDALTDGIKEMQLRADEFVTTGAGSAAEAFDRLGFEARDLRDQLEDPAELFLEITKRLEGLDKAAQIRVADEVFGGTAGERFVELLAQGEDALRATMRSADDLGIVLGEDVLQRAEEVDRKFSEIQARLATFGKTITINIAEALINAFDGEEVGNAITSFEQRMQLLGETEFSPVSDAAAAGLENLAIDYEKAARAAMELSTSIYETAYNLGNAGYIDAALQLEQMAFNIDGTARAFQDGKITAEQFRGEIEATTQAANDTVVALGKINGVDLSGIVSKIGDVIGALATAAAQARETRRAIDDAVAAESQITYGPQNGRGGIQGRRRPTDSAPTSSPRPELPSVDATFGTVVPRRGGSGGRGGGGGGGGAASILPTREAFEAFAETLASEAEKLEIWRSEQLEKLAEFRAAKLGTEQEFNELEAAIQKEHADRLTEMEARAREDRMRAISDAFGDLSTLMQTENEKLFKIGKAAALAEATVSGYQAAVSAWEKGMEVGGPPVAAAFTAASLARTGAMISNIASQQIGGGSRGGGGGGVSTAAAAAPLQARLSLVGSGEFIRSSDLGDLLDQLSDEAGDRGYRLMVAQ